MARGQRSIPVAACARVRQPDGPGEPVVRSIRISLWRKLILRAGLELRVVPSALLLILGGDFPGLVAVTPVPAAAAKSAYAVNDPGNLGEGMSLGFAINASGEVFGRSHRDKGVFSKRDRHERGNRGQPPPRARVPARTQLVTTARTYHPHHLAERTDTGGGPP